MVGGGSRQKNQLHQASFANALIQANKQSSAFYRSYGISAFQQAGRPTAPNYHPEHARNLAENSRAFYRRAGDLSSHATGGLNAVTRKSNALLEKSRLAGSMKPASGGSSMAAAGVGSTVSAAPFVSAGSQGRSK